MAPRATQQQVYDALLTQYGKTIADAFEAAIQDLRSNAELGRAIRAIQSGNIEAAIEALHLDPAAYAAMLDQIQQAYANGGQTAVGFLPSQAPNGVALVIRFNARNLRAENWLRDHSSELITRILDDQREAVRSALVEGMARGVNPTTTALDIVGRVEKATGRREGGILGLSAPQAQYVQSARKELADGDPEGLRNYLTRERRDKRFDRTVQKAIDSEAPVPADVIRKAVDGYERKLLKLRGDMIGRTEALTSLHAAQHEALQQAVDSGALTESQIRRVWSSVGDMRVRHTHRVLDGDTVGLNETFRSPSGARLRFPGDPLAPASERIACRCSVNVRVDWAANVV